MMRARMKDFLAGPIGLVLLTCASGAALAAPPIAFAARTQFFGSNSTTDVPIPLRNNGATTLSFETTTDNQRIVITYNAECVVTAPRGVWLTISVFLNGNIPVNPASGQDFALCTALDTGGESWGSVSRQSVFTVAHAGTHTISITGKLRGGSGSFGLDDSSLVVQRAQAFATRTAPFSSSESIATELPIKDNGGKALAFSVPVADDRVKLSYNGECVVDASPPGNRFIANFVVDGQQLGIANLMCSPVDTTAKTWAGALRQQVVTIPESGAHQLKVIGALFFGPGTYRIDDTSLVVTRGVLAYGTHDGMPSSTSTAIEPVPIKDNGGFNLSFTTTAANQVVRFGFSAECQISAPRGRWLGIRIMVDGEEATPASGYDFALCSSGGHDRWAGFRQSFITVPAAGDHLVRVYARISGGPAVPWALSRISMVVE